MLAYAWPKAPVLEECVIYVNGSELRALEGDTVVSSCDDSHSCLEECVMLFILQNIFLIFFATLRKIAGLFPSPVLWW